MPCTCTRDVHLKLETQSVGIAYGDDVETIIRRFEFGIVLTVDINAVSFKSLRGSLHVTVCPSQIAKHRPSKRALDETPSSEQSCMPSLAIKPEYRVGCCGSFCQRKFRAQAWDSSFPRAIIDQQQHPPRSFDVCMMASVGLDDGSFVSLGQILEQPSQYPRLTLRDKLQLSVIISSSVLQLHQTPWLPDIVSSWDIFFFVGDTYPPYSSAFVVKEFLDCGRRARCGDSSRLGRQCNATLLSLGILLIELMLGKTLNSMHEEDEAFSAEAPSLLQNFVTA
ncbi:hypothetical protein HRG_006889 [Hirsutella rhossiliensis]|uniref:DUF7580 domain-containing protein n=1 Tax=Hirsutella rhossiliensis TaxID=111463 RepID=A0A9P8MVA9_9HYPO|nr:uncharacterized protein HRG_06889 [Hirsutella rhossiliensis]KAH0961809.1 hypothetical protein HRG_06889 [Hirsutella rhossiliensis]